MFFFKKLHIKILSVALLVTLISYDSFESRILPQQFTTAYVVSEKGPTNNACYKILKVSIHDTLISSAYAAFDFRNFLDIYNSNEKVVFNTISFNSNLLKSNRHISSYLTEVSSISKGFHDLI